jgi:3-hydroxyacyl-CoA dehydrogenase
MGSGIAQVAAQAGNNVKIVELKEDILKNSKKAIEQSLPRIAKKHFKDDAARAEQFVKDALSKLTYTTDIHSAVSDADLVVEAIIENLGIKQKLFAEIDKIAPEKTLFASNTSSLSIKEIAELTSRKDRFGGLHFFSPVPVMKLLEVVRIPETSDATHQAMDAWGKSIGKVTVTCKDTPGFIVNRLLIPYSMEAVRMAERGDASVQDIDTAMKLGCGYPMGPFELADFTGVDIGYFVIKGWAEKFPDDPTYKIPENLEKMIKEGKLGRKTGEGYYKYNK